MTAINVVLKRDSALMMTDAAMYGRDGEILAFGQKAIAMPTLKAAIACRGGQIQTAILAMELPLLASSFDDLTDDQRRFAETLRRILKSCEAACSWHDLQIVIAGISKAHGRARGFCFDTTTDELEEIEEYAFGPLPNDEEFANLHTLGCEIDEDVSPAGFRADKHGIPLMEAQRRMKTTVSGIEGGGEYHIVGGNILVTEITADGVSQRVIHEWADEAGKPLEPTPFLALVNPSAGLSRADRRRLAKQGRKAA